MSNHIVNNYGFPLFGAAMMQPQIELAAYALTRGNYSKEYESRVLNPQGFSLSDFRFERPFNHLLRAIGYLWDGTVDISVNGHINRPLLRILEELCDSDDVGIAGNASSSKTFGASLFFLSDWMASPSNTLTFLGTTALKASEDRVWGTVARLHSWCKYPVGTLLDSRYSIVYELDKDDKRDYSNAIKAIAFEKGSEGRKALANIRGRKNSRVRACIDEMAEMDMYVGEIRSNLSANNDLIFCGIANPLPGENPHRILCTPDHPDEWESLNHKTSRKWKTKTGTAIFISGEDSPNFDEGVDPERPPFPYLLTHKKRQRMLEIAGGNENSLEYWRNAIGFWPIDSTEVSVVTRSQIRKSNTSFEPVWDAMIPKKRCASLDCGFTSGGDENILSLGYIARLDQTDKSVGYFAAQKKYDVSMNDVFEDALAVKVVKDLMLYGVKPEDFGMDISGDGGKIYGAIIRHWSDFDSSANKIIPISSMGTPTDRRVSEQDRRKSIDAYDRLVTEYWFSVHHAIACRAMYGLDVKAYPELVTQLCSRQYTYKGKKISVEPKKEMKERTGKSPDRADSFVYLLEVMRRRGLKLLVDKNFGETAPDPWFAKTVIASGYNDSVIDYGSYEEMGSDPDGF